MKRTLYKEVFEQIKDRIKTDVYKLNEKLPGEQQLADEFGVSTITVKRALTELKDAGYLSRKPKEGTVVIAKTASLSAVPDTLANDKPLIGLIVTNFDDTFGTNILNGILGEKADQVNIIVKKSLGDSQKEGVLIKELIEMNVNGLILLPSSSKYLLPTVLDLASQRFPMVMIDRTVSNLPISSITTNNVEAAKQLTSYLIGLGHKRIGMLTSSNIVSSTEERIQGFMEAHAANKAAMDKSLIQSNVESVTPNSSAAIEEDIRRIADFIRSRPDMTALVAAEYNIALLIRQACEQIGKKIPQDLSVVCFDHPSTYFDKNAFVFTHIKQKQYQIGKKSVELLLEQISDAESIKKIVLEAELVTGSSSQEKS